MSYEGHNWRADIAAPRRVTTAADLSKQPNEDRIYKPAWLVASTTLFEVFTPSRPVALICLGSQDQSGAVVLESDEIGGSGRLTIAPHAPCFKRLTKPFKVRPVFQDNAGFTETSVLDVSVFYEYPPYVPVRAPMVLTGTLSGVSQVNCCTMNRRRVRVFTQTPQGGASANVKIWGYCGTPTAFNGAIFAGDNAVTTEMFYEWDPTVPPPAAAFNQRGVSVPDRVAILLGTNGRTVEYNITAWDY